MMKIFRIEAFFVIFILTAVFALPSLTLAVGPEDQAPRDQVQTKSIDIVTRGTVTEIPAMTLPSTELDFDLIPQGPTSIQDILGQFPDAPIINMVFDPRMRTAVYDFQTGGGRALSANPNQAGGLYMVDPSGMYGEANELIIELSFPSNEMGFEIGDWAGPFNANLYAGDVLVGSITVETFDDKRTHFIESTDAFNKIVLTPLPQNIRANWVVPALILQSEIAISVPTVSEWGAIVMVILLGLFSLSAIRRNNKTTMSILAIFSFFLMCSGGINAHADTTPTRTLTFVNNCNQDIWVGASGNTGACVQSNKNRCVDPPACRNSNECIINEYCTTAINSSITGNKCSVKDCSKSVPDGGCPPAVRRLGTNTGNSCVDKPCNPNQYCNPATNSCWTLTPEGSGCFCEMTAAPPRCAFRQCRYVPVNGTENNTGNSCVSNQDCGKEVSGAPDCTNNPCQDNQYCKSTGTSNTCFWVGGEISPTTCTEDLECDVPLQYCNPSTGTCWAEQYCNSSTETCFVVPTDGNGWLLGAAGGATPDTNNFEVPVTWAGRFWARTNCRTIASGEFNCDTGACLGMGSESSTTQLFSEQCELSGSPPVTIAEAAIGVKFPDSTLKVNDFYDVSMTDSANLGVSIVPDPDTYEMTMNGGIATTGGDDGKGGCKSDMDCPTPEANTMKSTADTFNFKCDQGLGKCVNAYVCGSPGCVKQAGCAAEGIDESLIEHCMWDQASVDPQISSGFAVAESSCTASILGKPLKMNTLTWKCDSSGKCGNADNSPAGGTYQGCLGADVACAERKNNLPDLNCLGKPRCDVDQDCVTTQDMAGRCVGGVCVSSQTTKMRDLYGCTVTNATSCYTAFKPGDNEDNFDFCCGCAIWSPENNNLKSTCTEIPGLEPPTIFSNPEWEKNAEPIAEIFHNACPQAYSFPFDDKVATFTCSSALEESNVDYTITFCPQIIGQN